MAKKRSVPIREVEDKARAEIQAELSSLGWRCKEEEEFRRFTLPFGQIIRIAEGGAVGMDYSKKRERPKKNRARNWTIMNAVRRGVEAGLKATRGRDQRHIRGAHSACSLVADELKKVGLKHMSEDAVEKIWRASEKSLVVFSDGK